MTKLRRLAGSVAILLGGCTAPYVIWLQLGSRQDRVVFRVAESWGSRKGAPLSVFRLDVYNPSDSSYALSWGIYRDEPADRIDHVEIGAIPPGWSLMAGSRVEKPLAAGCYEAETTGARKAVIQVTKEGTVLELAWSSCRAVYDELPAGQDVMLDGWLRR